MAVALLKFDYMDEAYQLMCGDHLQMKKLKIYADQLGKLLQYYGRQWMKPSIRTMLEFHHAQFRTNNWNGCESSIDCSAIR